MLALGFDPFEQRGAQPVGGLALGCRQTQPLHPRRSRIARRHEQCGQLAAFGGRAIRSGLRQDARNFCLGPGLIEMQRGAGIGGIGAIAFGGIGVKGREGAQIVALRPAHTLDHDHLRRPSRQPIDQRIQQRAVIVGRQCSKVRAAQHQHLAFGRGDCRIGDPHRPRRRAGRIDLARRSGRSRGGGNGKQECRKQRHRRAPPGWVVYYLRNTRQSSRLTHQSSPGPNPPRGSG